MSSLHLSRLSEFQEGNANWIAHRDWLTFPAPTGPTTANNSPAFTSKLTLLSVVWAVFCGKAEFIDIALFSVKGNRCIWILQNKHWTWFPHFCWLCSTFLLFPGLWFCNLWVLVDCLQKQHSSFLFHLAEEIPKIRIVRRFLLCTVTHLLSYIPSKLTLANENSRERAWYLHSAKRRQRLTSELSCHWNTGEESTSTLVIKCHGWEENARVYLAISRQNPGKYHGEDNNLGATSSKKHQNWTSCQCAMDPHHFFSAAERNNVPVTA